MKYTEVPPAPANPFNELIRNYWKFEIPGEAETKDPIIHETLPDAAVSVVFINQPYFQGLRLLGPQTKRFRHLVYPGSVFLGIRFNPWINIEPVWGDKKSIMNRTAPAPEFLGDLFPEIDSARLGRDFEDYSLLEKGLARLVQQHKIVSDPLAKYICLRLSGELKIKDLLKEIPLSTRPVQKNFKAVTGVTMTEFRNIIRLSKTIKMIHLDKENTTNSAFENGYTDHSHFIKTFRKYMDTSVKEFLSITSKIELTMPK